MLHAQFGRLTNSQQHSDCQLMISWSVKNEPAAEFYEK